MMNRSLRLWVLKFCAVAGAMLVSGMLTGCAAAGPSAADVALDRTHWTMVRDFDASEKTEAQRRLFAQAMDEWNTRLMADEAAVGRPLDAKNSLMTAVRVYGSATVQAVFAPKLQARAPLVFRLIDANSDGVLSDQELASVNFLDPVVAAVVVETVIELIRHRR